MAGVIYVFDTNMLADLFDTESVIRIRIREAHDEGHTVVLCAPVHYEIVRGLMKVNATRKLALYRDDLAPLFEFVNVELADWQQAAQYWVDATSKGRQLSDMDLLIAAITARLDGVLVSSDADFDALLITREDWRSEPTDNEDQSGSNPDGSTQ